MLRELVIMRHGKSSWASADLADRDRPLKVRGRRDAQRMGAWMNANGWQPNLVYASPAKRSRQTVTLACEEIRYPEDHIMWHRPLYFDGLDAHLRLIKRTDPAVQRLMLVGHNPDLDTLVRHLVAVPMPAADDGKLMTTSAVAWLSFNGAWEDVSAGELALKVLQRPKWLNNVS